MEYISNFLLCFIGLYIVLRFIFAIRFTVRQSKIKKARGF